MKTGISASTYAVIEAEVGTLMRHVSPSPESRARRWGLVNYIKGLFDSYCSEYKMALGGSFPLQVYLPESDMDVTVMTPDADDSDELSAVMKIFSCLCQAIKDNTKRNDLPFAVDDAEFKIESIEFVNARVKVVKCIINRMSLDITANQRNSLASAIFLEEANRLIGNDNIFKKGIIIVKVWCFHESAKYNNSNVPISGSKEGMFSSYALSILVLYLFNLFPGQISSPLHVLHVFFETFTSFQFDKYVLTLNGPVRIQERGSALGTPTSEKSVENRFGEIANRIHTTLRSKAKDVQSGGDSGSFRLRTCNIVDPVDPVNNLGMSVTWKNFRIFKSTLTKGLQHLNDSIKYMEASLVQKAPVPPTSVTDSGMTSPPPNPSPMLGTPPPSQRKAVVNMDALSGAVNGIAPGLNFPSKDRVLNSAIPPVGPSSNLPNVSSALNTSPTVTSKLPSALTDVDLSTSSAVCSGPSSLSPPPPLLNTNGNPSPLLIAPSISPSPTITGIATCCNGNANRGSNVNLNNCTQVIPTNTSALSKEFRFLKRFFPNCFSNYHLENFNSSSNEDTSGSSAATYSSKYSRSTSPFRDPSPVMTTSGISNKIDRSTSVSGVTGVQSYRNGALPSRSTSDNSTGLTQPVSFLGAASMPCRTRSQSYASLQSDGSNKSPFDATEHVNDSLFLLGDLDSMWHDLKYESPSVTRKSNVRIDRAGNLRNNFYETDSSDTFTSVDDVSPPRSPPDKKATEISSLKLTSELKYQEEEKEVEPKEKYIRSTHSIANHSKQSMPASHLTMPPLIKKMPTIKKIPPLDVPAQKQHNSFSLLESPISRQITPESDVQTSNGNAMTNSGINAISTTNNAGKSKRKKGKLKETVDSVNGNKNNKSQSRMTATTSRESGIDDNENQINVRNDGLENLDNSFRIKVAVAVVLAIAGVFILYITGVFISPSKSTPEMRSAYMKAHQHQAYESTTTAASGGTNGAVESEIMGSGFGKTAHSSVTVTYPLEDRVELSSNDIEDDDDDEKNMSLLYEKYSSIDENESAIPLSEKRGLSQHSVVLEDANDLVNVAELWMVKGQNITLGLSDKAQESYHLYMKRINKRMMVSGADDVTASTKHEGMWFKDSTPLIHSNSSMYLKVNSMNVNTTGTYTFAIVKQKIRKGFSARPRGKLMTVDSSGRLTTPPSATAVASVNGDIIYREGVSIIDAKIDPSSFEIIKILSRTVLRLGAAPHSRTKAKHLVLTLGSQLYLNIEEEGSPRPRIQWYKNGIPLKKEQRNVLIVNNVNKSHDGTYTCALTNMAGRFMWVEATVIVRDK